MSFTWLSHIIDNETPLYGGRKDGIRIDPNKSMAAGDSCNTSTITMPAHAGTHVDAPRHFVENGQSVDAFSPETWVFRSPWVINLDAAPGQLIEPMELDIDNIPIETDICLFKTSFKQHRQSDMYWQNGPGIAPSVADVLVTRCPDLRAVGMDFISISSLAAREIGRAAHRSFLGKEILIIEDMKLSDLAPDDELTQIVCLPLRISAGDGAPCTILGTLQ